MDCDLVTVIVTTYKRSPDMLMRSVNSIINQTYENLEIIIVDDSPEDFCLRDEVKKTVSEIKDDRITYLVNSKNMGACASRNRAINISNGQYIMYVDDDDELVCECVEKRIKKHKEDDTIGLVYSDCYILDEVSGIKRQSNQEKNSGFVFDKLMLRNFVQAFPTIKRCCFEECGLFDESLLATQDYEMWLRIAQKFKFDYVDEPLSVVHIHSGERISTNPHKKIQGAEKVNILYSEYLKKNKYAYHIRLIKIAPYYMAAGRFKEGLITWLKGTFIRPFDFVENLRYTKRCFLGILECNKNKRLSK